MKYLALHLIPLLFGIRKSAKSVILAGVALATVPCVSTVSGQDSLSRDLLAHWPLDGDLKDAYGAFDGVFRGTDQIQFERGVLDLGLQLDGFDQYVVIEPETEDNFDFQGRVPVTLSVWFRADDLSKSRQALITKGPLDGVQVSRWPGDTTLYGSIDGLNRAGNDEVFLDDENRHHLVLVSDPNVDNTTPERPRAPSGVTTLYIDGKLVDSRAHSLNRRENTEYPLAFGETVFTLDIAARRSWQGLIDDVAIWKRALDLEEIERLWNEGDGESVSKSYDVEMARRAGFVPSPIGILYRVREGTTSSLDDSSARIVINDVESPVNISRDGDLAFVQATFVEFPEVGSIATFTIEARDTLGNPITDSGSFRVLEALFPVPSEALPGPTGETGLWGIRQFRATGFDGTGFVDNLGEAFEALVSGQSLDAPRIERAAFSPVINFSNTPGDDIGFFEDDLELPAASEGIAERDFGILARATMEHGGGDLTIGVHTDEGFALRIIGAEFSSVHGKGMRDPDFPNVMVFSNRTTDSDTRGILRNLPAGRYDLEFLSWNFVPQDSEEEQEPFSFEIYSADGAFESDDDTEQWTLLGAPGGPALVQTREESQTAILQFADVSLSGIVVEILDTPGSAVVPGSVVLEFGNDVIDATVTKTGSTTRIEYTPEEGLAPGVSSTWTVRFSDANDRALELSGGSSLPSPPFLTGTLEGPRGEFEKFGIREIRNAGEYLELEPAVLTALAAAEPGFEGTITDSKVDTINFSQPGFINGEPTLLNLGRFDFDEVLPGTPDPLMDNFDQNFVVIIHGFVEIPRDGDYAIEVRVDDGFALRLGDLRFSKFSPPDSPWPDFPQFLGQPDRSDGRPIRGLLKDVSAGVYELEFIGFQGMVNAQFEISTASGEFLDFEDGEDIDQFFLIGGEGGWALVDDPAIAENLRITGVAIAEDETGVTSVSVSFNSALGRFYRLFRSSNLVTFSELEDGIEGNGAEVTVTDQDPPKDGDLYYRIELEGR